MSSPSGDRLAVWGDPIDHSRSPALHTAAYRVLGREWEYGRAQVRETEFAAAYGALDTSWRGLSLTFPLKSVAYRTARHLDEPARLTGAVNTYLLTADGPRGFNTDVGGLAADLRSHRLGSIETARVIGAGSTATSALLALAAIGVSRVDVVARRPEAVAPLERLGEERGIAVRPVPITEPRHDPVPLTIAALPGGAHVPDAAGDALAAGGGLLYDVVYGQWPTSLAARWRAAGHPAAHGLGMLLHQALRQIRIFTTGDPEHPLEDEAAVLDAMRIASDEFGGEATTPVVGD